MTTPYPAGYIPARNVVTGKTATPEQRRVAQTVLDRIEADRAARLAPAHFADLRNPPDRPDMGAAYVAMGAAFVACIAIVVAVRMGWGF